MRINDPKCVAKTFPEYLRGVCQHRDCAPGSEQELALKDLRRIPGVGLSLAQDLYDQGFRSVEQLRGANTQAMYER